MLCFVGNVSGPRELTANRRTLGCKHETWALFFDGRNRVRYFQASFSAFLYEDN